MLGDLLASDGVVENVVLRGPVGVLAMHGGLEAGTAELARQVALRTDCSLYAVVQPADLRWHVPSTRFDPGQSDGLRSFLGFVGVALSLHGFGREGLEGTVLLGGANRRLAHLLAAAIKRETELRPVSDLSQIPGGLRGLHPANPVNLARDGGVQIELSSQAREPDATPGLIEALAAVVRAEQRARNGGL